MYKHNYDFVQSFGPLHYDYLYKRSEKHLEKNIPYKPGGWHSDAPALKKLRPPPGPEKK